MLEIFIIWKLAGTIGTLAAQKGLKKIWYQIMLVVLWLTGEISGAFIGGAFSSENTGWVVYLTALAGAAAGAGLAFLIMRLLPKEPAPSENVVLEFDQDQKTALRRFGWSGWVPGLVIVFAILGLCACFSGLVLLQIMLTS